jgi:hypothetical protein
VERKRSQRLCIHVPCQHHHRLRIVHGLRHELILHSSTARRVYGHGGHKGGVTSSAFFDVLQELQHRSQGFRHRSVIQVFADARHHGQVTALQDGTLEFAGNPQRSFRVLGVALAVDAKAWIRTDTVPRGKKTQQGEGQTRSSRRPLSHLIDVFWLRETIYRSNLEKDLVFLHASKKKEVLQSNAPNSPGTLVWMVSQ